MPTAGPVMSPRIARPAFLHLHPGTVRTHFFPEQITQSIYQLTIPLYRWTFFFFHQSNSAKVLLLRAVMAGSQLGVTLTASELQPHVSAQHCVSHHVQQMGLCSSFV